MKYFLADTHFSDDRLDLFFRNLLFDSADEVDKHIIKQWNNKIKPNDTVYHLGDVALSEEGLKKVNKLNGKKILIKGNYDVKKTAEFDINDDKLLEYFDDVFDDAYVKIGNETVYLNHYPTKGKDNLFNIVGHIHSLWKVQRNMINVGLDAWLFQPVSEDIIKFTMNGIRKHYDDNVFAGELKANTKYKK